MKKTPVIPKTLILMFTLLSIVYISCSNSNTSDINDDIIDTQNDILPKNLELTITILNANASSPTGDGSGQVQLLATADNAVKFGFKFGNAPEIQNTTGVIDHTFTNVGTNNYTVSVLAYSNTNNVISTSKTVRVYVSEPELQLVWSDEFDVDGSFNTANWTAEVVPPANGGWHNGEKQHYTNRLDNVYTSNGILKIVAKKETYTYATSTKQYTSARLITKDKVEFKYGRLDVRAKLPAGAGTWPAIWTLGANIDSVGWPACGEIDIMEHWGYEPGLVHSATHNSACSGSCANVRVGTTTLADYNTSFHTYSIIWNENEIRFLIDDEFKYSYAPPSKNNNNWPYNADQFIILNVAMGGSWFEIDPNFTESAMEVDYVRLYQ